MLYPADPPRPWGPDAPWLLPGLPVAPAVWHEPFRAPEAPARPPRRGTRTTGPHLSSLRFCAKE